ncbi:type 1 glutamine amidotransferase [Hellea sp.]|nr:type 1 glutamine amidotransferase [Hellea sp.]
MTNLNQSKVLFLATNGFQEDEMFSPRKALTQEGATVHLASFDTDSISAGESDSRKITPDMTFEDVDVSDYDAVVIPGGVVNPDKLRTSKTAVNIVRDFAKDGKVIAAICHAPWMLAEADILRDREATSYASIKTDMINAGASWKDEAVVVSNGIITSRSPDDLEVFNAKIIEEIKEGTHNRTLAA